ncbi:alpha/beta hydrolase [Lolliginicoccus levis]|uniref:alpha/beta hydrolase n=1 Tax=Lolliginicoccus levis TaxID=2919542 RepID=UPI0024202B30|nr:alpha/beta hydrolase family protein [Lolliginicoccus levis]
MRAATHQRRSRRSIGGIVIALLALIVPLLGAAPASAAPRVDRIDWVTDRFAIVHVYSPSMNKVIPNEVFLPANRGAASPSLYLLPGVDGGQEANSWFRSTNLEDFFANKHVKVVSPIGGRYSLYTDWNTDDPILGRNKWITYLSHELPSVIDATFPSTGRNAVGGLSLSGASALDLGIQAPGRFQAVASYSGCPRVSSPESVATYAAVVAFGGGNVFNAYGPPTAPGWYEHDPSLNADRLRGKAIYLAAASGIPGDRDFSTGLNPGLQALGAGIIEGATGACTAAFANQLTQMGIPHTYTRQDTGAHTWGLFEHQMRDSWRVLGPAIGG